MNKIANSNVEILVVSPGGVGTTFLINFLSDYFVTNRLDDRDNLKHYPVMPNQIHHPIKIIYLFGDPLDATISLFRRDFFYAQIRKMNLGNLFFQMKRKINSVKTIDQYLDSGTDNLRFRKHYESWRHGPVFGSEILFIRYETLFENLEEVFLFVGLSQEYLKLFPEKRTRKSSTDNLSETQREKLESLLVNERAFFDSLPDIEMVKDNQISSSAYMWYRVRLAFIKLDIHMYSCITGARKLFKKSLNN